MHRDPDSRIWEGANLQGPTQRAVLDLDLTYGDGAGGYATSLQRCLSRWGPGLKQLQLHDVDFDTLFHSAGSDHQQVCRGRVIASHTTYFSTRKGGGGGGGGLGFQTCCMSFHRQSTGPLGSSSVMQMSSSVPVSVFSMSSCLQPLLLKQNTLHPTVRVPSPWRGHCIFQ